MNKKKGIIISAFILCSLFTATGYSPGSVQHGPLFGFSYFPLGYGRMNLPYAGIGAGTASTIPEEGNSSKSAGKYSLRAGYYYDFFQGDISYGSATIRNQLFNNSDLGNDIPGLEKKVFLLRGGKRFSDPGDSTYHLLYFGLKRMISSSEYEDMKLTVYGYLAGYEGFYTFGIKHPVEFVIKTNAYIGTYRKDKFKSDQQFENIDRKNSLYAAAELGIGFLNEPLDTTILVKLSGDFDHIAYRSKLSGQSIDFACRTISGYLGFEIIYAIPNFKYNSVK